MAPQAFAPAAPRLAAPVMQLPGQVDPKTGGAVPFAPLGTGGGGSTATGAALGGVTGHIKHQRSKARAAHLDPNVLTDSSADVLRESQRGAAAERAAARAARAKAEAKAPPQPPASLASASSALGQVDRKTGGAMPFAPLGTAGGGSTASGASLGGVTGHIKRRSPYQSAAGLAFTDSAPVFGTAAERAAARAARAEAEAKAAAMEAAAMMEAAAALSLDVSDTAQITPTGASAAASAAASPSPSALAAAAGASLVDKKHEIMAELSIPHGNLPSVAAAAADQLGVDTGGKHVAKLLDECYDVLFG